MITDASGSHVSIAIIRKAETAETKIAKLGTGLIRHDTSPTNEY